MSDNLGERIRQIRGKMTQIDFANLINCPQAYISRYENGVVKPSIDFVYSLVCVFNISLDWLMTGEGEMFTPRSIGRKNKTEQKIQEVVNILKGNNKVLDNLKGFLQNKRAPALMKKLGDLNDERAKSLISLLRR